MTEVPVVSAPWQSRFAFFHTYGLPTSSPQSRDAFKQLSLSSRMRINSNFLAFLFGPIYFFAKGMWRKGLTLLSVDLAVTVALYATHASDDIVRATGTACAVAAAFTANWAFYLHVVEHSRSWNLLEGFGRKTPAA